MAYFDSYNKCVWNDLAESFDLLEPYELTDGDVKRSHIIANEILNNYQTRDYTSLPSMKFGSVLEATATSYYNLGFYSLASQVVDLLSSIQYQDNKSNEVQNLTVLSGLYRTGAMICKKPIYIDVPRVFNKTSISFMVHETAHMLKESNPYECRGVYTDLEVIPITMELINAYILKDFNVFKKREYLIFDIAYSFKKLDEDLKNKSIKSEDLNAFNACYRQNILYLNSFYYALKLFSMYLEDEDFVLNIIYNVLSHRLTTKEVVDSCLLGDDSSYEFGISQFRSVLK